jgi:hypothetical protein
MDFGIITSSCKILGNVFTSFHKRLKLHIVIYKLKTVRSCMQLSLVGWGFPVLCCYEFYVVVCTGWLRCQPAGADHNTELVLLLMNQPLFMHSWTNLFVCSSYVLLLNVFLCILFLCLRILWAIFQSLCYSSLLDLVGLSLRFYILYYMFLVGMAM